MSKKGLLENNEKKMKLVRQMGEKRAQLKAVIMDRTLPLEQRFETMLKLSKMPRNSSHVRVRTRCIETGRPRAVYRFCGLSRNALRELATKGGLPGVRRSSW